MAISDYSMTPASNTTISGTNIAEGCQPSGINDALRQMMADIATWSGTVYNQTFAWCGTAGGSKNALTLTPTPPITAYAAGQIFRFKSGATASDAAVTVAISGLATKAIQSSGAALTATVNIAADQWYEIIYDGAAFQIFKIGLPIIDKVSVQKFTSSGTCVPTSGMTYCIIECWGGGGGGGGMTGTVSGATCSGGGGGGGAGSYSKVTVSSSAFGSSQTVTIGAAGYGGAAGNNNGGDGGATSVGTLCVTNGGGGGQGQPYGVGGSGGSAGTGDIAAPGAPGFRGISGVVTTTSSQGGQGASSSVGQGARGGIGSSTSTNGTAATGYAAGGSGGTSNGVAASVSGGAGAPGLVVITEYISA